MHCPFRHGTFGSQLELTSRGNDDDESGALRRHQRESLAVVCGLDHVEAGVLENRHAICAAVSVAAYDENAARA